MVIQLSFRGDSQMNNKDEAGPRESGKKKQRRGRGDKRERILNAAIRVFAEHGFYATRVSEIAKTAGVADGTIYLYFKNKDDVLITIFEERIGQLIGVLEQVAQSPGEATERIERIVEIQLGVLEQERDLAEVVTVNLRQSSRLLKQYATPLFLRYLDAIAQVIADGQSQGSLRDDVSPRLAARMIWGGLDGIALTWALGGAEPAALKKAARESTRIYLQGLVRR